MPYLVLARKWRPKTFASLKGQEHVTKALSAALSRNTLHHAFLFTGTRGVGKTTIARIMAKCLNCERGVSATPCGECTTCIAIDQGRFVDLIEVDGASRTKVEDTKELLENVQYAPTQGRYKIYLIDEVHMLSMHSFNALLKTLEEPPPHVKFIFATTALDRIPVTILSRCLRFNLRALSIEEINANLTEILTAEQINFAPPALIEIAKAGQGSMRDALSILEQAIAYGQGQVEVNSVLEMLGLTYQTHLPALLQAIEQKDLAQCLQLVEEMDKNAADFEQVLMSIVEAIHTRAIQQQLDPKQQSTSVLPEEWQLLYQIALMGHREIRLAPRPRLGFEMTLMRMVVFRPEQEKSSAPVVAPVAKPKAITPAPVAAPIVRPAAVVPPAPVKPVTTISSAPAPAPIVATTPVVTPQQSGDINWAELSVQLPLAGLTKILVQHCVLTEWNGQKMTLTLDEVQKACLSPQRQTQIQDAIAQYLKIPVRLNILIGKIEGPTPVQQQEAARVAHQDQVKANIENDKTIQNMLSAFDGRIEQINTEKL